MCFSCQQPSQSNTTQVISPAEATELQKRKDSIELAFEREVFKKQKIKEAEKKAKTPDFDTTVWTELIRADKDYILDIRYATENNFVEEQLYDCPRCFLRPDAAAALQKAHDFFKTENLRIKLLDCYRPRPIQQKLWDKVPNASYVTPPSRGSMHNRGLAIDLTLVNEAGKQLDMGTPYDFFGQEAHHTYTKHSEEVKANRKLLKSTMEKFGFRSIRTEWWHYNYGSKQFKIDDMEWKCH
ncbi:MAG: M15 family metallopeptidase [Saprospiraceae bacterium]